MKKTTAHLIFIGTELIRGKENKYPPLFCSELTKMSVEVTRETSLPDNIDLIAREVKNSYKNADIVLITGGLGPTFDDITREAVSKALGRKLVLSKKILTRIKNRFKKYRRPMTENNIRQAYILDGATAITNAVGTAPGQYIKILPTPLCKRREITTALQKKGSKYSLNPLSKKEGGKHKKLIALLPGPYIEWHPMFAKTLKPQIAKFFKLKTKIHTYTLKITDIGESQAEELLSPVIKKYGKMASFAILSSPGDIRFNIETNYMSLQRQSPKQSPKEILSQIKRAVKKILGNKIYGTGNDTLEKIVGRLFKKRSLTLAVAESCTGGLISHKITQVSGSSAYFKGAIVAYSNELKKKLLCVKAKTLKKYGAVSIQTAIEMAKGAVKMLESDCAVAVTGIAGPGGAVKAKFHKMSLQGRGNDRSNLLKSSIHCNSCVKLGKTISQKNKPVGLVYIALITKGKKQVCQKHFFSGTRSIIKTRAATAALNMLRLRFR